MDARLPDGTRLHAVLPPVATDGPYLSLRTSGTGRSPSTSWCARAPCRDRWRRLLAAVVAARLAYLVTGGTGSGKTTLLNTLLGLVPATERIVLVEDAAELRPGHPHVVRLEARTANVEGAGAVGAAATWSGRRCGCGPDRLVVGECRGGEVVDLLAALNTGHDGGCGTLHANTPSDVPARLEALGHAAAGCPAPRCTPRWPPRCRCCSRCDEATGGASWSRSACCCPRGPDRLVTVVPAWVRGSGLGLAARALGALLRERGVAVPPILSEPWPGSAGPA